MAVDQSHHNWLTLCHRGQAPSHLGLFIALKDFVIAQFIGDGGV